MEEDNVKDPVEPEKERLVNKAKKFLDKAEDFIEDKVEDVKKSEAFKKSKEAYEKAEDYVEDKIEDIKKSGVKEKLGAFAGKVEDKTEETVAKMKELGKKAAVKTADKLEDLAENLKKKAGDTGNKE